MRTTKGAMRVAVVQDWAEGGNDTTGYGDDAGATPDGGLRIFELLGDGARSGAPATSRRVAPRHLVRPRASRTVTPASTVRRSAASGTPATR